MTTNALQREYRAFRKKYAPMLRDAKRHMDTTLQKQLVDVIAGVAFNSGFRADKSPGPKVGFRPWKGKR